MTAPTFSGENATFYAGGIVGMASSVTIQNSYAAGTITANNNKEAGNHPHAGGIAAVLEGEAASTITIQSCAALSPQINWRLYTKDSMILNRIAIQGVYVDMGLSIYWASKGLAGQEMYPENTPLRNNIANAEMVINYEPSTQQTAKVAAIVLDPGPDTVDGADTGAKPAQSVFEGLGWNFSTVWTMGSDGYPALRYAL
jgi:hypothetical protein